MSLIPPDYSNASKYPSAMIYLTKGKWAVVDADHYDWLNEYKWFFHRSPRDPDLGYAVCMAPRSSNKRPRKRIYMHKLIAGGFDDGKVDHKNRDRLHNQRHNLRPCTNAENQANMMKKNGCSSRFKGVFQRPSGRWTAYAYKHGRRYPLGGFSTELAAANAYNKKAQELWGEFALLNDIGDPIAIPITKFRERRKKKNASSKYTGVSYQKNVKKWSAYVWVDKSKVTIGYFVDETEAARAYNAKATELWGDVAFLNILS